MRFKVEVGVEVPGTSETNAVATIFLEIEAESFNVAEVAGQFLGKAAFGADNVLYSAVEPA